MIIDKDHSSIPEEYNELPLEQSFQYCDKDSNIVGYTAYYGSKKTKRMYFYYENYLWKNNIDCGLGKIPLFNLTLYLKAKKNEPILIADNEFEVEIFRKLGFCAIASAHDWNFQHETDWSPLNKCKQIFLFPINDEIGERNMKHITAEILKLDEPPIISIVRNNEISEGKSFLEWLKSLSGSNWNNIYKSNKKSIGLLHSVIVEALLDAKHIPEEWGLKKNEHEEDEWPEPGNIKKAMPSVMTLSEEMLPIPIRGWVVNACERLQAPFDLVAISAIIAIGSLIGSGCGIKPKQNDDWVEFANLWGILIANPSNKKSPAMNEIMVLIQRLQNEINNDFKDELKKYQLRSVQNKAKLKAIENCIGRMAKLDIEPDEDLKIEYYNILDAIQEKPNEVILKTNETTIPKLTELLKTNSRGIFLVRDEIVGLLAKWENNNMERAYYLAAWSNKISYVNSTIARGNTSATSTSISVLGTAQPDTIKEYVIKAKEIRNDGLIQRFQLAVYPDELESYASTDISPDKEAAERVYRLMRKINNMNFVEHGGIKMPNKDQPYFKLSSKAQKLFNFWYKGPFAKKIAHEENPIMKQHLAKYSKLVPSLALIFHCIHLADKDSREDIKINTLKLAIKWSNYLESHSRRIYSFADKSESVAEKIIQIIDDHDLKPVFSIRDIYSKHRSGLGRDEVNIGIAILLKENYIKEVHSEKRKGRPSQKYEVNPKAFN